MRPSKNTLGICKSCKSDNDLKRPNVNSNVACSSNPPTTEKLLKPSRKKLLRIRYYEFKLQMEGFCERMFHRMTFQHFRSDEIASNPNEIEEKGLEQAPANLELDESQEPYHTKRTSPQTPTKRFVRSHTSRKRFIVRSHAPAKKRCSSRKAQNNLTFEADDEESELEPGEVPGPDQIDNRRNKRGRERERMKSIGRRVKVKRHSSQSDMSKIREGERRQRKKRSSLTSTKGVERTVSDSSIKSSGSKGRGCIENEPKQVSESVEDEKSLERQKAEGTFAAEDSQTTNPIAGANTSPDNKKDAEILASVAEELEEQNNKKTEAFVQTESGNIQVEELVFPSSSCYKKNSGSKKTFMEQLVALANRRRTTTPGKQDITFGFKIVPVTGRLEGRRGTRDEDEFNSILPIPLTNSTQQRTSSERHNVPMGGGFIEGNDIKMKYARLSNLPAGRKANNFYNDYMYSSPEVTEILKKVAEVSERFGQHQPPPPPPPPVNNVPPVATTIMPGGVSGTNVATKLETIGVSHKLELLQTLTMPLKKPMMTALPLPTHPQNLTLAKPESSPPPLITPHSNSVEHQHHDKPGVRYPNGSSITGVRGWSDIEKRLYIPQTQFTSKFYSLLKDSNL